MNTRPYVILVADQPTAVVDTHSASAATAAYAAQLQITARTISAGEMLQMRDLPEIKPLPVRGAKSTAAAPTETQAADPIYRAE